MSPTELSRDRVNEVSLIVAPEGHEADGESGVLWWIPRRGSTQERHVVGTTPAVFVEEVHRPGGLERRGLAETIDTEFDAVALLTFVSSELRSDQVLEPDGYFTPRQFSRLVTNRCAE